MYYAGSLLIFVAVTRATVLDDQPYCALRYRRLCQGKGQHVGCQFPYVEPGSSCQNYSEIKFTSDLRNFITHDINRRRQRIASGSERVRGGAYLPQPEVMMLVGWDRELAFLAQRLANQCNFVHDECRATVRYPYSGQSVGEVRWRRFSGSQELGAQRAIRRVFDAWWGERRRVMPKQLTTPFKLVPKGMVWGHFSQLAIWTLRAVGCGAALHGGDYTRLLLVCDFSHTNMLGQRTIKPGRLVPCPVHTERRARSSFPLLCGPIKRTTPAEKKETLDDMYKEYDDVEITNNEKDNVVDTTTHMTALQSTVKQTTKPESKTNDWNRGFDNNRDVAIRDHMKEPIMTEVTKAYYPVTKVQMATRRIIDKLERELEMRKTTHRQMMFKKLDHWKTRIPILERTRNNKKTYIEKKDLDFPQNQKYNKEISGIYSNREFNEEKMTEDLYRGKEKVSSNTQINKKERLLGVHRNEENRNKIAKLRNNQRIYEEELSEINENRKVNVEKNQENDDQIVLLDYHRHKSYEKGLSGMHQNKENSEGKMSKIDSEEESDDELVVKEHPNYKSYEKELAGVHHSHKEPMKIHLNQRGNDERLGIQRNRNQMLSEVNVPRNYESHKNNFRKGIRIPEYNKNYKDGDTGIEQKFTFDESTRPSHYRTTITNYDPDLYHGTGLRHKWKQTRIRPQRPGANALLSKSPEKIIYKSSSVSLMLDNDDLDQLFKDTGFNVHWRKQALLV